MTLTDTPWTGVDALKTTVLVALGCVVWAIGWFAVSGKPALEDQIAPMNIAVVGFVVAGGGYANWFLAGRRAVGARRRSLLTLAATVPSLAPVAVSDGYVGSERLFHRPGCAMADGRSWPVRSRAEQEHAGRVPCGMCRP